MKKIYYCVVTIVLLATIGCSSSRRVYKDYLYFQKGLDSIDKMVLKEPIIKPYDQLNIQVYSTTLNQEQVTLFNIPNAGGYLVDEAGYIVIPVIGRLYVAELTTTQLRTTVLTKLATQVKNPEVIVRFLTYKINVLGEVSSKGIRNLPNQRVTLLDLIGNSGDLTESARRDNILVIRDSAGYTKHYEVDIRDARCFTSPGFQLQQNDIVYVRSTDNKLKSVNTNPNFQKDIAIITTLASLLILGFSLFTYLRR